jgi:hypothetical protein
LARADAIMDSNALSGRFGCDGDGDGAGGVGAADDGGDDELGIGGSGGASRPNGSADGAGVDGNGGGVDGVDDTVDQSSSSESVSIGRNGLGWFLLCCGGTRDVACASPSPYPLRPHASLLFPFLGVRSQVSIGSAPATSRSTAVLALCGL